MYKDYEVHKAKSRERYHRHKHTDPRVKRTRKRSWVKHRFKITLEDYERRLAEATICAVCGDPFNDDIWGLDKVLDHDHKTFRPRDVLHRHCNVAIGLLKDDPEILERAVRYLRGAIG